MRKSLLLFVSFLIYLTSCKKEEIKPTRTVYSGGPTVSITGISLVGAVDLNKDGLAKEAYYKITLKNKLKADITIYVTQFDNTREREDLFTQDVVMNNEDDTLSVIITISSAMIVYNNLDPDIRVAAIVNNTNFYGSGYYRLPRVNYSNYYSEDLKVPLRDASITFIQDLDQNNNNYFQPPVKALVNFRITNTITGTFKIKLYELSGANYLKEKYIGSSDEMTIEGSNKIISDTISLSDFAAITKTGYYRYNIKAVVEFSNPQGLQGEFSDNESLNLEPVADDIAKFTIPYMEWKNKTDNNANGYSSKSELHLIINRSDQLNKNYAIKMYGREYGKEPYTYFIDSYLAYSTGDTLKFEVLGAETLSKNLYDFSIQVYEATMDFNREILRTTITGEQYKLLKNQGFEKTSEDK